MLTLKPTHKIVKDYYSALQMFAKQGITHETAIKNAFQSVLTFCCKQMSLDFIEEYPYKRLEKYKARIDGAFLDQFKVPFGYWEAKDSHDDLVNEVRKKFDIGYPRDNIIFQAPERAIIYQGSTLVLDEDITHPDKLVNVLKELFHYKTDTQLDWENAVEEFKLRIPESAGLIIKLIEEERNTNSAFISSFEQFTDICRKSINPNLSVNAIEEMLVQHLLTERIFRTIFQNPDFVNRNIIAHEIDKVITSLTSRKFNRNDFLKPLDRFYTVLEKRATEIDDYSIKQTFLNTVYEKFFQGFAIKVADTHGIVYTPQPIVDFMVSSVDEILKREFSMSLSSKGVHILDPFAGTNNFSMNILRRINKTDLKYKFTNEIHANEIMLLPYYIACMNIEHQYYELTGEYIPFPGMCLVDTFQLAEDAQASLFTEENTQRVEKLKQTPIFVFIGNPPYNAGQANENDNNKNRKYPVLDKRVSDTFGKDSKATLLRKLQDPYVKAFRFAIDKVIERGEGIVAYVSNNSFIEDTSFDGMRKHIFQNFDQVYILNLKGNVRQNPKISGTTHNVFGIQVGVSINILIRKKSDKKTNSNIFYTEVDDFLRKEDRYKILENAGSIYNVAWKDIQPDSNHNWLNEGMQDDWVSFPELGSKDAKAGKVDNTIFKLFSLGISTNRDSWVYNSNKKVLLDNINLTSDFYNDHVNKYLRSNPKPKIDDFVSYVENKISWSSTLKDKLQRGTYISSDINDLRCSLYRPFNTQYLYFNTLLIDRPGLFPKIFSSQSTKSENLVICISGIGSSKPFHCLMVDMIPCLDMLEKTQCFPFYTYDEDDSNRRENISDWALKQYRVHYQDNTISKWDIFYYIYGVLHKLEYRTKYAANLRRSLPRIPYYDDFRKYSEAGKELAELHVNYEHQPEYPLVKIEAKDKQLDWKVVKMKLSKDRQTIIYNDFLSLTGIPPETFEYKLGSRSALDWIIDQYQVSTDKRSGITNDPNRPDDPDYIVRLIGKIVTVSLETVKIVREL